MGARQMRVPVYQQQVTPQIPSVRTQVQVPEGATGVALKPIDTSQGIAQGVESLRLGLVKLNENREKFMLASAVNEYRRANTEFLHAKDTGVFAKKGKNVFGVTQQFDEFSTKTRDDIAKQYRMNGEAKNRFLEATSSLYNSSLSSVMTHEQRETDAAQQAEWKAMYTDSLNNAALVAFDDAACKQEMEIGIGAVAQSVAHLPEKAQQSAIAEYVSKFQTQRVASILEKDAKAADAFLKAHKGDFIGTDYLRVRKAVDDKLDVIKVQETIDNLMHKFKDERSMIAWIRAHNEGEMENKLVTAAKSRWSEQRMGAISRGSAELKARRAVFYDLNEKYWSHSMPVPINVLEDLKSKNKLSKEDFGKALHYNEVAKTRKSIEFDEIYKDPSLLDKPEELQNRTQQRMGISDDQVNAARAEINASILNGTATQASIHSFYLGGYVSKSEEQYYQYLNKNLLPAVKAERARLLKEGTDALTQFDVSENSPIYKDFVKNVNARTKYLPASDVDNYEAIVCDEAAKALPRNVGFLRGLGDSLGVQIFETGEKAKVKEYRNRERAAKQRAESGKGIQTTAQRLLGALPKTGAGAKSGAADAETKKQAQDKSIRAETKEALNKSKK